VSGNNINLNLQPHSHQATKPSILLLVVDRVIWVRKIKNNTRVRLSTTTVCEFLAEVNRAVEIQASIIVDIDV